MYEQKKRIRKLCGKQEKKRMETKTMQEIIRDEDRSKEDDEELDKTGPESSAE